MPMYSLIEYSDNYPKTSGGFWQYYRDDLNNNITEFESFKYKIKITGKIPADSNTKDVKIVVPLKYLINFWGTLEMPLINGEITLILTWSVNRVISSANEETKFKITDSKLYVPVVTLSIEDIKNFKYQKLQDIKIIIDNYGIIAHNLPMLKQSLKTINASSSLDLMQPRFRGFFSLWR